MADVMTEKDLKHLRRIDLLELMLEQGREIEQLKAVVAEQEALLAERTIRMEKCGTLAEAAFALNGVLEAAQAAADQYLENIRAAGQGKEADLEEFREQCAEMERAAEERCAAREAEASRRCREMESAARERSEAREKDADNYADTRMQEADSYYTNMVGKANDDAERLWNSMYRRMEDYYSSHPGLKEAMEAETN